MCIRDRLIGLDVLSISGSLVVRINNTGASVSETIGVGTAGETVSITFTDGADIQALAGSIDLDIAGFLTLTGDFGFEKTTVGTDTKILVGAANVNTFLGTPDGALGVEITGAELGLVMIKQGGVSSYAMTASGSTALIGIPGIALSGALAVRVNNTGATVNETVAVGTEGDSVSIVFDLSLIHI